MSHALIPTKPNTFILFRDCDTCIAHICHIKYNYYFDYSFTHHHIFPMVEDNPLVT